MKRLVTLVTVATLSSCVPPGERLAARPEDPAPPRREFAVEAVVLTKDWIHRALTGDFGGARQLTRGQNGEPEALDGLAETLFLRNHRHGLPTVLVFHHSTTEDGVVFVCAVFRFPELVMNGALVSRQWPGQGLRVSEFHGGMEGCNPPPSGA